MEKEKLYPEGIVQQTEDFALRQKIKKIVGENIEDVIKEETIAAFKKLGYEEKDGYMFVVAAGGKDNKEKEIGKGTAEGKLIVTVSVPKMLNMGAVKPVSYMQKVTTFGGKKMVGEIYLEIKDKTVYVEYKNTEAAAYHQSSEKDTYAPNKLNKSGIISGLENEKSFKKDFKKFFEPIAEAEAQYLLGTKIANDDKVEKNMNDSIIKENTYTMKLTDIFSSSFEEAGDKINNLVKESLEIKEEKDKKDSVGTPKTPSGEPTEKELVIGSEDKTQEDTMDEITASGGGAAGGAYLTPHAFTSDGKTKAFNTNKSLGYTEVQMNEAVKDTTYGMMRTPRAHKVRQEDGSYKIIAEGSTKTPYVDVVEMGPDGWPPKGMEHPFAIGKHGIKVNSPEELAETGHGELSQLEKKENKSLDESFGQTLNLIKRKFSSLEENEKAGINKRYIITEKLSKEQQSKRWKQLYENDCFCGIKDSDNTISRDDYEQQANKEFNTNNQIESDLCNTQFSGEEEGFVDIPKAKGSMIVFRISESDIKANKMYLIDHFTKKMVLNPVFKSRD